MTVVFDPELYQAISELAEVAETSKSSLVVQLLRESIPAIKMMTKAAKAAKEHQGEAFDLLAQAMFEAQAKASQMGLELMEEKRRGLRRAQGSLKEKKKGEV